MYSQLLPLNSLKCIKEQGWPLFVVAALHHQWSPLFHLLRFFGVFHSLKERMILQRFETWAKADWPFIWSQLPIWSSKFSVKSPTSCTSQQNQLVQLRLGDFCNQDTLLEPCNLLFAFGKGHVRRAADELVRTHQAFPKATGCNWTVSFVTCSPWQIMCHLLSSLEAQFVAGSEVSSISCGWRPWKRPRCFLEKTTKCPTDPELLGLTMVYTKHLRQMGPVLPAELEILIDLGTAQVTPSCFDHLHPGDCDGLVDIYTFARLTALDGIF